MASNRKSHGKRRGVSYSEKDAGTVGQQWGYVKTKTAATSPSAAALRTIRDAYGAPCRGTAIRRLPPGLTQGQPGCADYYAVQNAKLKKYRLGLPDGAEKDAVGALIAELDRLAAG